MGAPAPAITYSNSTMTDLEFLNVLKIREYCVREAEHEEIMEKAAREFGRLQDEMQKKIDRVQLRTKASNNNLKAEAEACRVGRLDSFEPEGSLVTQVEAVARTQGFERMGGRWRRCKRCRRWRRCSRWTGSRSLYA
jgi:hypothetical protein